MGSTRMDLPARLCSDPERWTDWSWQQQNAVRTVEQLQAIFPDLPSAIVDAIRAHAARRRLQITPYALSLVETNASGTAPADGDPMWRQFVPHWDDEGDSSYSYDGVTDNWEMPDEMVTPIAQRKYELPSFTVNGSGPVVRYRNWRGEHVEYPDADWLP